MCDIRRLIQWHLSLYFYAFRLIISQPLYTQRLLVLLFGTFRVIASNSERAGTGMSSEAIGVSVAPSFFQSCVSDGKTARMEDVLRYKVCFGFLFNSKKRYLNVLHPYHRLPQR